MEQGPGTGGQALFRTPLTSWHERTGARMFEFAGWWMPVQYSGIVEEHLAVRRAAGVFDLSHMGEIEVRGADAPSDLNRLVSCNVATLQVGQARYGVMCLPSGGIIDDLVVMRTAPDAYLLVVNAACRLKDLAWLEQHLAGSETRVEDRSDHFALIAVQGPQAEAILRPLAQDVAVDALGFYRCAPGRVAGVDVLVSRTGYTGEDGFELFVEPASAERVWEAVLQAGVEKGAVPVGLGARDTLRLEARYPLYGHDIDETTTPFEAGLGWTVDMGKGEFVGRFALAQEQERGPLRRLVGFVLEERAVPRQGYPIVDAGGHRLGEVTSGTFSPVRQEPIGLGYVPSAVSAPGTRLFVEIRGKRVPGRVVAGPFVTIRTRGRSGLRRQEPAPS